MQTKENQSVPSMTDFQFYKTLLHPEKSAVKVKDEDADLYLSRTLYPTLLLGLEDLAAQVEKLSKGADSRVCNRFNACAYLAEFLMRNNPRYNPERTKELSKLYEQYAKKARMERVLTVRKALLRSLFMRASGTLKEIKEQVRKFIEALDEDLGLSKKLKDVVWAVSNCSATFHRGTS